MFIFIEQFYVSSSAVNTISKVIIGGKFQDFPGVVTPPDLWIVFGTNQTC